MFGNDDGFPIVVEPSVDSTLVEGDEVTFTCQGIVGSHNTGQLVWFYYIDTQALPISAENVTDFDPVETNDGCINTRLSIMKLRLTRELDNTVIRCTVQQDTLTEDGDGHKQTNNLDIQCK